MLHRKVLVRLIVITVGAGVILLSLFAFQLGLDNNAAWGSRRLQILCVGMGIVLLGALGWIMPALSHSFETTIQPVFSNSSIVQGTKISVRKITDWFEKSIIDSYLVRSIKSSGWFGWISKNHISLWLLLIAGCVLWAYVWILTIGRLDKWPIGRNYYGLLTQAFEKGQTSLVVEPTPELLKLKNPYDLGQRKGLDYLWDTSLYEGKYYLYWGPVPAVLGVLVNLATSKPITDARLVFWFVSGTVLFSVLLLKKLYQDNHFSEWIFWGGAFASLVNIPLIWLFTHPAYYEASIAGGQFFMMAGFFLLYLAFRPLSMHKGYVMLSLLTFGLAGGTRISLLPSVIFLAAVILWRIFVAHHWNFRSSAPAVAAALIPLLIVASSLSWYNYVRFGSIFEFGHRYQLSGLASTADEKDQVSIHYLVPNVYTYIFRLPSLHNKFPFVTVPAIKQTMWPSFIHPPENYYYAEPSAGILFIVPLIGFTALVLFRFFWLVANGDTSLKRVGNITDTGSTWFMISIFGYVFIQMTILSVFVSSSMRYLFDVIPALIILSSTFVGVHIQSFEQKSYWIKIILCLWMLTALLTVISGFLVGFTGAENNFMNKNPQVYYQFLQWFSR